MRNKNFIFLILPILFLFFSGCETFKGAYDGAKKDFDLLMKADQWMQKNFW